MRADRLSLGLVVALGCGSLDRGAPAAQAVASTLPPPPMAAASAAASGSASSDASQDATPAGLPAERMVIREAELRLRARNPRKTADEVTRIATEVGGFVLGSQLRAVDADASEVEIRLRVPQQALDATLQRIRKLEPVLAETVSGQDVTEEFVDVSARLRAQRTLETRLLALLEHSAALEDLLLVEQELARVRGEIEQREGRLQYLKERSRMAAIKVVAQAPEQPVVASAQSLGSRFGNAFERSADLALSVTEALIQVVGSLLPIALLALALVPSLRWMRRARIARRAQP